MSLLFDQKGQLISQHNIYFSDYKASPDQDDTHGSPSAWSSQAPVALQLSWDNSLLNRTGSNWALSYSNRTIHTNGLSQLSSQGVSMWSRHPNYPQPAETIHAEPFLVASWQWGWRRTQYIHVGIWSSAPRAEGFWTLHEAEYRSSSPRVHAKFPPRPPQTLEILVVNLIIMNNE